MSTYKYHVEWLLAKRLPDISERTPISRHESERGAAPRGLMILSRARSNLPTKFFPSPSALLCNERTGTKTTRSLLTKTGTPQGRRSCLVCRRRLAVSSLRDCSRSRYCGFSAPLELPPPQSYVGVEGCKARTPGDSAPPELRDSQGEVVWAMENASSVRSTRE